MYNNCFMNRELSWLRFNERVLEEAENEKTPLCERLSFLSIFQSNLDEFFMVRIGSLQDQMLETPDARENKTNMTAGEQIGACISRIRDLCHRRDMAYGRIMKLINAEGKHIVSFREMSKGSEQKLHSFFSNAFLPYLSTFYIGKKEAFPFLKNKEIYAVAVLESRQGKRKIAIIPCSGSVFPRLVADPEKAGSYILSEELILHFLPRVFEEYRIVSKTLVRVTRNADIDADSNYDEELNYRDHMAEVIRQRTRLCPVRMEMTRQIDDEIIALLCEKLGLSSDRVFEYDIPLDVSFLSDISDELRNRSELFYTPRHPQRTPLLEEGRPVLDQVLEKDVLLHYPYESIRPFLNLLSEAAHNPRVRSIRMTLYRLARNSKVIESLVDAAENGKQVAVFVELKARFDEENNIEWSRRLERAGCRVIYGIEHIKVHSKLCLIELEENGTRRWITQIGTGNYNEKTSRLYTDLCLMTAHEQIAEEARRVFSALMEGKTVDASERLLVSPNTMHAHLIRWIDREIEKAKSGRKALIRLKMNSVTDRTLMLKLVEASRAGVEVRMIVRGICCLLGGVPGDTENIHVVSIVGRFLEHARVYMFGDGELPAVWISSADFMTRNMVRRVEVASPVYDQELRRRIVREFDIEWQDNVQARDQLPDGHYLRRTPGDNVPLNAQEKLYDLACENAPV